MRFLKNLVRQIGDLLRGHSRPTLHIDRLEFEPLDVDAVARELKLVQQAATNGAAGLPRASATTLDGPQAKVVQMVEKHVATNLTRVQGGIMDIERRVAAALDLDPAAEVRAIGARALQAIQHHCELAEASIARARAVRNEATLRHDAFRRGHQLSRGAVYPRSSILAWGWIVALGMAEAAMNAYYFTLGSELGLLGGLATSAMFAAIDLTLCTTLARWATNLNHRSVVRRFAGGLAAVLVIAWIPSWGLFTGHLREALQPRGVDLNAAFQGARESFLQGPLSLTRLDTWGLVGLGIILSISAAAAAWRLDDPYPGYGEVRRSLDQAREEEEELSGGLKRGLKKIEETALKDLGRCISNCTASQNGLDGHVRTLAAIRSTVHTFTDQVTRSTNALLHTYRDENARHRPSTGVPAYFDTQYEVELPRTFRLPDVPPADELERMRARVAAARAEQDRVTEQVHQAIVDRSGV